MPPARIVPVTPQPNCALAFHVRDYGAVADGRTLDTAAINRTIEAAHRAGGGLVIFSAGDYLSHSLQLRSRVTLQLEAGATLIAADPPNHPDDPGYDAPEDGSPHHYQDFGHSRFRNSLIWGDDLHDVAICGPGKVYGRGLSRGNGRIALPVGQIAPQPPGHLPDVLEADGHFGTPGGERTDTGDFGYPNDRDTLPAGVGNKAIALRCCRGITIRDLTLLHAGHFAILASGCSDVTIERVLIDTNRDGIDIDACANVRITHCSVNSPWDDGICIKASCGFGGVRAAENITVSDCYVSGFEEGTLYDGTRSRVIRHRGGPIGRIKLGTEGTGGFRNISITHCRFEYCRGLALEQVDGGVMENIVISHLTLHEVMNAPIFIRLGARLRGPEPREPGSARRIAISEVVATDVAPDHGIFIAGLPENHVRDVRLNGIRLYSRGGGTEADAGRAVPEMRDAYPEPMLFGALDAWGLYIRHASELQFRDITLQLAEPDARPAVHFDDVTTVDCASIRIRPAKAQTWRLEQVHALRRRDCDGIADSI